MEKDFYPTGLRSKPRTQGQIKIPEASALSVNLFLI